MNLIEEFKKGQDGGNKGIPFSSVEGLKTISDTINGVQRGRKYVIGAPPKTGKTTLADAMFVMGIYLEYLREPFNIEWVYFSFEINRIEKEFEFCVFFMNRDYGITHIGLPGGSTKDGENEIPLSSEYLMGRVTDDQGNLVKVSEKVREVLKSVYTDRIIPLFGEYDSEGLQITKGLITFIKDRDNPTGLKKFLESHAEANGKFHKSTVEGNHRTGRYIPNDPFKYTIVITDHVRKVVTERNFNLKQTVDKYSEYTCDMRDICGYTFVDIVHTNRFVDEQRLKFSGDMIFPNSDDLKETGNLAEDANYVFTMFNPNDERYRLSTHFGHPVRDRSGNLYEPELRTVHLVDSRHCYYPQHFKTRMKGNLKTFEKL